MTDSDNADDQMLHTNIPAQVESLQHSRVSSRRHWTVREPK